jgi:hypothetical protein
MKRINYKELKNALHKAFECAYNSSLTSWRLPVFVGDNGKIIVGDWMSQGSYQPGATELYSVKSWTMDDSWHNSEGEQVEEEELSEQEIQDNIDDVIGYRVDEAMQEIEENNNEIEIN